MQIQLVSVAPYGLRVDTRWDNVFAPFYHTAAEIPRRPTNYEINGMQVFMPEDVMSMPIYVILTELGGHLLTVSRHLQL